MQPKHQRNITGYHHRPCRLQRWYSCEEERHLRRRLYRKAFEPVSTHSGTNYPCRQSELDKLQLWPGYNHERFVSPNEALKEIKSHNRENRRHVHCGAEQ